MTTKKKSVKRGPYKKKAAPVARRRSPTNPQELEDVPEGIELFKVEDNVPLTAKSSRVEADKIRAQVNDTIRDIRIGQSFVIRKMHWDLVRKHLSAQPAGMVFRSTAAKENKNFARFWRVK